MCSCQVLQIGIATSFSSYQARLSVLVCRDGVSRLSAYHHYGMVSPFKVARDATMTRSNGAAKYIDEFFTWREVAHAFCFHTWPNLETTQVLAAVVWKHTVMLVISGKKYIMFNAGVGRNAIFSRGVQLCGTGTRPAPMRQRPMSAFCCVLRPSILNEH